MKNKVVIFTHNNARLFINPPKTDLDRFKRMPNAVINPDLSLVNTIRPQYWKKGTGNKVLPMNVIERLERDSYLKPGMVNDTYATRTSTIITFCYHCRILFGKYIKYLIGFGVGILTELVFRI